jgi:hypothetical protein
MFRELGHRLAPPYADLPTSTDPRCEAASTSPPMMLCPRPRVAKRPNPRGAGANPRGAGATREVAELQRDDPP